MSQKVGGIFIDTKVFDLEHGVTNPPTQENLNYLGLCIAGEAGEFANVIKKIVRGGGNQGATKPELLERAASELVDIGIYFCEGVDLFEQLGYNFDKEWNKKFEELRNRPFWQKRRVNHG
jgi:NTP pyrophosphatase (non-canonical NTP hydrolase)